MRSDQLARTVSLVWGLLVLSSHSIIAATTLTTHGCGVLIYGGMLTPSVPLWTPINEELGFTYT